MICPMIRPANVRKFTLRCDNFEKHFTLHFTKHITFFKSILLSLKQFSMLQKHYSSFKSILHISKTFYLQKHSKALVFKSILHYIQFYILQKHLTFFFQISLHFSVVKHNRSLKTSHILEKHFTFFKNILHSSNTFYLQKHFTSKNILHPKSFYIQNHFTSKNIIHPSKVLLVFQSILHYIHFYILQNHLPFFFQTS